MDFPLRDPRQPIRCVIDFRIGTPIRDNRVDDSLRHVPDRPARPCSDRRAVALGAAPGRCRRRRHGACGPADRRRCRSPRSGRGPGIRRKVRRCASGQRSGAARRAAVRIGPVGPRRADCTRGRHRAHPGRTRRSMPHGHHNDARTRCHRDRAVDPGRAGRPLCARRHRGLSVECGDECRAGPGRRSGVTGRRQPTAGGVRWPAAPHHSGGGRTAGRGRGVGGRRRAGRGTPGFRWHRYRRRRTRTGRHDHRSGQYLRDGSQTDLPLAGRYRLRGRPDRDRDPGRLHRRPGTCGSGSDQPGRTRCAGGQRAGHRQRRTGGCHRYRVGCSATHHRAP